MSKTLTNVGRHCKKAKSQGTGLDASGDDSRREEEIRQAGGFPSARKKSTTDSGVDRNPNPARANRNLNPA